MESKDQPFFWNINYLITGYFISHILIGLWKSSFPWRKVRVPIYFLGWNIDLFYSSRTKICVKKVKNEFTRKILGNPEASEWCKGWHLTPKLYLNIHGCTHYWLLDLAKFSIWMPIQNANGVDDKMQWHEPQIWQKAK